MSRAKKIVKLKKNVKKIELKLKQLKFPTMQLIFSYVTQKGRKVKLK